MALIHTTKVTTGMILARDVANLEGRVLLRKGLALSPRHVTAMKAWGIERIHVEVADSPDGGAHADHGASSARAAKIEEELSDVFRHTDRDHPVIEGLFQEAKDRRLGRHDMMLDKKDAEILKLIRGVKRVSSPPTVLTKINALCKNPDACVADFERALATDQSLVLRLLKMVNSAFYGLPGKVDSISRAILIIGFRGVRELVFASSLFNTMGHSDGEDSFDIELFWQHSFASGIASRVLADFTHKENPESFFISGLLHDIGRLVLLESNEKVYSEVFKMSEIEKCPLTEAEERHFGFTHAEVGRELTLLWKLPRSLAQAVAYHHKPSRCVGVSPHADIVHLANLFVTSVGIGSSGDHYVPPLDPKAWDRTALATDQIGTILDRIEEQYEEGVSFLRSGLQAA